MKKIRKFHSSRGGKPLQLWTPQWKRLLVPRFPVTSVTIYMLLKRGSGNTKGWSMENPSLKICCNFLLHPLPIAWDSPQATVVPWQCPQLKTQPGLSHATIVMKICRQTTSAQHTYNCGGCDEVFNTEEDFTNHEWTVHPNMCHICFKFSVDWSSYLTHFHQEHLSNESSVWFPSKWLYCDLNGDLYACFRQEASTVYCIQIVWFWSCIICHKPYLRQHLLPLSLSL